MSYRARDSQRSKVYTAEQNVRYHLRRDGLEQRLETVDEIQSWVDSITSSQWWASHFASLSILVKDGRGRKNAGASPFLYWEEMDAGYDCAIKLPRWARSKVVILHEIAHHTARDNREGAHGRKFCRNFLALVKRWIGDEVYRRLCAEFKRQGVKWNKKRNLSPEQRQAMAERARANFGLTS